MSFSSRTTRLSALRGRIAALEAGTRTPTPVLPFGDERLDACFPGGGLPLGRWHEVTGVGLEVETAACVAGFTALLAAPLATKGEVVWIARRGDLYAPGLHGLGLSSHRLIQVLVRDEAAVLAALEDALGSVGVAAAVAEIEQVDLTAGRRLQLACERAAATGFVIQRRPYGVAVKRGIEAGGSASASRWRVAAAPTQPAREDGEAPAGLGPARWSVSLERCRGGRPGAFLMEHDEEARHGAYPLRVVAQLGGLDVATPQRRRAG